jgi:hypothetical protein
MGYFLVALIAIAIGFILGLNSKAQAKTRAARKKRIKEADYITDDEMSVQGTIQSCNGRKAPPPPPPSKIIREGQQPEKPKSMQKQVEHVKPGIIYKKDTFVKVNKCTNCEAIGHEYDMFRTDPCPKCGGDVKRHGAAKWYHDHWAMSKA